MFMSKSVLARMLALAIPPAMLLASHLTALRAEDLNEPVSVLSKNGKIDSPLTVLFGKVQIPTPAGPRSIEVRAYGLEAPDPNHPVKTHPLLPGPTFVFRPGELLRVRFQNYLNRSTNPRLNIFEIPNQQPAPGRADDIGENVPHEINIPNNADISNLHVHGLHVDPKQDNVTLLVLPEDTDPSSLVPELQRFVPTINRWWTRTYQYKIPLDHLPGTYWYHAHKHGATSAQVENGMAGTLVMRPRDDNDDVIPGLWNDDPAKTHDRVLVLQELADFGIPQGESFNKARVRDKVKPGSGRATAASANQFTTINGQQRPTLQLPPGQLERWRFIIAGANHTTSSDIWVGNIVPTLSKTMIDQLSKITTQDQADQYKPGPPATGSTTPTPPKSMFDDKESATVTYASIPGRVKLIALDGITMWESRDVTPATPAMGSAGNRLDLLIQPDDTAQGTYHVYQNYPAVQLEDFQAKYPELFAGDVGTIRFQALQQGWLTGSKADNPTLALSTKKIDSNKVVVPPNDFNADSFDLGSNYAGMVWNWAIVNADGSQVYDSSKNPLTNPLSVAPLISAVKNEKTNGVEAQFRAKDPTKDLVGWQPMPDITGSKPVTTGVLIDLNIAGKADGPKMPADKDLNAILSSLSPAGSGSRLKKVNSSGNLVPGIPAYVSPLPSKVDGRQVVVFDRGQYTFNYVDKGTAQTQAFRQFWLNGRQFTVDDFQGNPIATELIQSPIVNPAPALGTFVPNDGSAPQGWTNQVKGQTYITNPGYYVPIVQSSTTPVIFNYDYNNPQPLTNAAITGLDESTPPVSTTAEEWLLVNNSDLFHPFHIHISPFFVTEIGQLNYDTTAKQWSFKTMTLNDKKDHTKPFSWVVGNWWDVITLPPHGYVKVKTWINVPSQFPADHKNPDSDLVVHDNSNVYGSWVLHCHILRHEDRGMMTMVNTVPKLTSLDGKWVGDDGKVHQIADARGALRINDDSGLSYKGTFNGGIGNPLFSQPWVGSMFHPNAKQPAPQFDTNTMCVTVDNKFMVLSTGHAWGRSQPQPITFAATPSLSGNWVDGNGNIAAITDTSNGNGTSTLTFSPVTPVWWRAGTGAWGVATSPVSLTYVGTQSLINNAGQTQSLTFCFTGDGKTIVFSNGMRWTKQ